MSLSLPLHHVLTVYYDLKTQAHHSVFQKTKKWLLPRRGDKYMTILTRRNNFWSILNLLHILMLIVETLNEQEQAYIECGNK